MTSTVSPAHIRSSAEWLSQNKQLLYHSTASLQNVTFHQTWQSCSAINLNEFHGNVQQQYVCAGAVFRVGRYLHRYTVAVKTAILLEFLVATFLLNKIPCKVILLWGQSH
jgi:hypothetical protein